MQKKVIKKKCCSDIGILDMFICLKKNLLRASVFFVIVVLCATSIRLIQKSNYYKNNQEELNPIPSAKIEAINQLEKQLLDYQEYKDSAFIMDINPEQVICNMAIFQLVKIDENSKVNSMVPWTVCKWIAEDILYEMVQKKITISLPKDDFYRIINITFSDESQTIKIIVKSPNETSGTQVIDVLKEIYTNYCNESSNLLGEYDIVLVDEYQYIISDVELSNYQDNINKKIKDTEVQLAVKESELTIAEKEAMTGIKVGKETLIDNWGIDILVILAIAICFEMIYIVHLIGKEQKEE